ncbi:HAMP domain-containing histidine kinase [Paenibacillus sp. MZ04-78.2]|uniref:HAMP domain-containing sensor histidine kinase n=1 Tax=Paenibacillus sp. MZ04-78.2 TaxID=2962034 RepID=UPI0020B8E207|nr:HAMP domain-containing histidine kinase [Paenibacillus sp. MZ04-78.2]MCP3773856.1 HAMP domain-containing histidine kinase [Paenibacillus sp. MZ04-78.2]
MKKLRMRFTRLPIKWQMTLWSAFMLFVLFTVYNAVQYIGINQWMSSREVESVRKTMGELQSYFTEKSDILDAGQIVRSRHFIQSINQKNQLIRILDGEGKPVLTVLLALPEDWVAPRPVTNTELESVWHQEEHLLVLRAPVVSEKFRGTIEIVSNLETFDELKGIVTLVMILGGAGAVLLSGLGGLLLAGRLLRPVQSITDTMRSIQKNGLQERVPFYDNKDEISALAHVFNEMMDQLETSFRKQKQFVEDASHELRTPISIISGHLSMLNRWGKRDPVLVDESLRASLEELERLKGLVQELLELTRAEHASPDGVAELCDLGETIAQIVKNVSIVHPEFEITTDMDALKGVHIRLVPNHIKQILLILLDNAVKYSVERNKIHVSAVLIKDTMLRIVIRDYGMGIPKAEVEHVFDRFYRVDKARSRKRGGSGLGLSIAKRLVEKYHGDIRLESEENQGTTVTVQLPFSR